MVFGYFTRMFLEIGHGMAPVAVIKAWMGLKGF